MKWTFARDLPLETTSAVAGVLWYPYRAQPPHLVGRWAASSLRVYMDEAGGPGSAVRMIDGLELRGGPSTPWFVDVLPDDVGFTHYNDLPSGYGDGWQMRLPVIEPNLYLRSLVARLQKAGGTLTRLPLTALPETGVVVNCSGLASRSLVPDSSVTPVQGQVGTGLPIPVSTPGCWIKRMSTIWCTSFTIGRHRRRRYCGGQQLRQTTRS